MEATEIPALDSPASSAVASRDEVPSFRAMFDEHHTFVFRSLLHLGVAEASVDDAVQGVFVVVHRRLGSYDPSLPLRAWVWGIARHVASDQRRSITRERRMRDALEAEPRETLDTRSSARESCVSSERR